jgi:hypothetical protein
LRATHGGGVQARQGEGAGVDRISSGAATAIRRAKASAGVTAPPKRALDRSQHELSSGEALGGRRGPASRGDRILVPLTRGAVAYTFLRRRLGPLRRSPAEGQALVRSDRSAEMHRHDAGKLVASRGGHAVGADRPARSSRLVVATGIVANLATVGRVACRSPPRRRSDVAGEAAELVVGWLETWELSRPLPLGAHPPTPSSVPIAHAARASRVRVVSS